MVYMRGNFWTVPPLLSSPRWRGWRTAEDAVEGGRLVQVKTLFGLSVPPAGWMRVRCRLASGRSWWSFGKVGPHEVCQVTGGFG